MLKVKSAMLSARWDWFVVEIETVCDGQHVDVSATLTDRWDVNSDSHQWEVVAVDPPEMESVIEDDLTKILDVLSSVEGGGDPCKKSTAL